jgi:hypothetical protein
MGSMRALQLFWILLVLSAPNLAASDAFASKEDLLTLAGGDVLTGEIKGMERGMLNFKTDATGTVGFKMEYVDQLVSREFFQVQTQEGLRFFGTLAEPSAPGLLRIQLLESAMERPLADIYSITPIKQSFWAQINGKLSLGFSFTQATDVAELSFDGLAKHRNRKRLLQLSSNLLVSNPGRDNTSRRFDASAKVDRFFKHRWVGSANLSGQKNDQLGIDWRVLISLNGGMNPIQTNHSELGFRVGLSANREWQSETGTGEYNLEGVLRGSFTLFSYVSPKTDITLSVDYFPSLTVGGRHRMESRVDLSRELVKDFFVALNLYDAFDSKPLSESQQTNDFSISTSLGWSF